VIRVGPYETLRLSRHLGISTTELLRDHTEAGGTVLRARDDRSCIFLSEKGCTVHPHRPLACRIYPLAWYIDGDGAESFTLLEGHPESAGAFGTNGTIDDYCASQGLAPYLAVMRRYITAHDRLLRVLQQQADTEVATDVAETRSEVDHLAPGAVATPWLDVDAVVSAHCVKRGLAVPAPDAIDAIIERHLAALDAWADELVSEG